MGSLNKVFLLGNLTREPELRYTPGGSAVGEFGLAVNRKFNDKEEVCFVDIVVWGKQAETCNRFLEKGVSVLVEGRLQLDQWQDKESGARRSRLRVVAERVQFLGRGGERMPDGSEYDGGGEYDAGGYQDAPPQQQQYAPRQQQQQPPQQQGGYRQQQQGGYRQQQAPSYDNQQGGGYRQQQPPRQSGAPAPQPPRQQQQQQPPPPPMPPEGAFDVDSAEDDIPF